MDKILQFITSEKFVSSVITVGVALGLWALLKRFFATMGEKAAQSGGAYGRKAAILRNVQSAVKYVIIAIAALTVMQSFGVNISSFIASFGIASAIVGLALQDMLKDIIMGVHIVTDKFYAVGDVVRYNGMEGVVVSFNIRTTKLKNIMDGSILTLCNRNVSEISVVSDLVDMDIPLAYEEEPKHVHKTLSEIAEHISECEGIKSCEYKGTQRFEDSAIIYKLRFFCDPEKKGDMWRKAIAIVQEGLADAGISIPYNQLDIHQK